MTVKAFSQSRLDRMHQNLERHVTRGDLPGLVALVYRHDEVHVDVIGAKSLDSNVIDAADQTTGRPLMHERIFARTIWAMNDTGFSVPPEKIDRLPPSYAVDLSCGTLSVSDSDGVASQWSRPPAFASGGGGRISTADDFLAFGRMLLNKGRHGSERILSRSAVELMTMDHLCPPEQKSGNEIFFGSHSGWGFGMSVNLKQR